MCVRRVLVCFSIIFVCLCFSSFDTVYAAKASTSSKQSKICIDDFSIELLDSPNLILVNKDNKIPDDYDSQLVSICNNRLKVSSLMVEDLDSMLQAAEEQGYKLYITSAYRSIKYQQGLVDNDVNRYLQQGLSKKKALKKTYNYLMPAGFSEHHTGLAIDILCDKNMQLDETQAKEPSNIWLQEHCQEFGFILRYPKDKEDITKIKYEPWHFRYVGQDVAEYIMKNAIVLEEFIDELKTDVTSIDSDNNAKNNDAITTKQKDGYAPMVNQSIHRSIAFDIQKEDVILPPFYYHHFNNNYFTNDINRLIPFGNWDNLENKKGEDECVK